jgi:hypothetical protein
MNKENIFDRRGQILLIPRGPRIVFYKFLKNILELEEYTNRNQDFSQWPIRKW